MSDARETGSTPERKRAARTETEEAMMQSADGSGFSIPVQATASGAEERIQIAGGSGVHVNDVLCGRGKLSFNHSKYHRIA